MGISFVRRTGVGMAVAVMLAALTACQGSATSTASGPSVTGSVGTGATQSPSSSAGVSVAPTTSAAVAASGNCQKVRFTAHAGLGVGAVHRYLVKPFKAGAFAAGAGGRTTTLVKAAAAGAFAVHEFRIAAGDIAGCPSIQAIENALTAATGKLTGLRTELGNGQPTAADLTSASSLADGVLTQADASGIPVHAQEPSALQLATGG